MCINAKAISDEHGAANKFCKECAEYYCEDCAKGHSKYRVTRQHKLLLAADISREEVAEAMAAANTPKCDVHVKEDFTMYCSTCKIPICTVCCISKHKQHKCQELTEVAPDFKFRMNSTVETTKSYMATLVSDLELLKVTEGHIQKDVTEAMQLVDETTEKLCMEIQTQRTDLCDQISMVERAACGLVQTARKEREDELKKLLNLLFLADNLKTAYDQVVHSADVREKLVEATAVPLQNKCVKWQSGLLERPVVTLPKNVLGTLNMHNAHEEDQDQADGGLSVSVHRQVRIELEKRQIITGLTTSRKRVYVAQFNQSCLLVFSPAGKYVTSIGIPGLSGPQGVAAVSKDLQDLLVVSCNHTDKLHFATMSEAVDKLVSHVYVKLKYKPFGVSMNSAAGGTEVIVAALEMQKVFVHGITGVVLHELDLSHHVPVRGLVYAEKCSTGYYLVTDCEAHQLLLIDETGKVTQTYDCKTPGAGYYSSHQAIRDHFGNVLVPAYSLNAVHWLGPDHAFIDLIPPEHSTVYQPSRICLNENAHLLYVGHHGMTTATVDIYKYSYRRKSKELPPLSFSLAVNKLE